ncbi:unnamed protein product, partial [Phaeothamnion confervicola]
IRKKSQLHAQRRLQHLCSGLLVAGVHHWWVTEALPYFVFISCLAAAVAAIHGLRKMFSSVNACYLRFLGPLLREEEISRLPGSFWFLLGVAG